MKEYKCECGKLFYEPQKFNAHKQGCTVHIVKKYGSIDAYYAIKNRNYEQSLESRKRNLETKKQKELDEWISAQHRCRICGEIMTKKYGSGIYCSSYCAHSVPKRNPQEDKHHCLCCGKAIKRNQTYCSNKCQHEFQYQQWIRKWKDGEVSGLTYDCQNSPRLRRYILEKYNYTCTRCGWSKQNQYTKTYPLEIEHLDGDYRNTKEENLTLLCPNCHALTKTYKGANRGRGRPQRRKT